MDINNYEILKTAQKNYIVTHFKATEAGGSFHAEGMLESDPIVVEGVLAPAGRRIDIRESVSSFGHTLISFAFVD